MYQEVVSSNFPRLETVRSSYHRGATAESLLFNCVVHMGATRHSDELRDALDDLASRISGFDISDEPRPEETAKTFRARNPLASLLHNLFTTISGYCRCECVSPHNGMLLLFAHRCQKDESSRAFTMLFSRRLSYQTWQEVGITISKQM